MVEGIDPKKYAAHAHTRRTLHIFWQHAWRYRWQTFVIILGVFLLVGFQTYTPLLYRDLINFLSVHTASDAIAPALRLVVLILIINAVRITSWRIVNFVNNYFQPAVMRDLTDTCYRYLERHSIGFMSSSFVGSLVTKVKRYERSFEQIADQLTFELGRALLSAAMILGVLLVQYRLFGLLMLGWCVLFLLFSYYYSLFKWPYDIRRAFSDTATTAQLADSITNNVNVKLFTNYGAEDERFKKVTNKQFLLRKKSWDLGTWGDVVQGFWMIGMEFLIIFLAVKGWQKGALMVGDIALLQAYIFRIFDQLWNTGKNIRTVYEALADANEMTDILETPHEIQDVPGAAELEVKGGAIEFRGVSFGYQKRSAVLLNFDLAIPPGERVALIGPSGGGKSTIVKLLLRFYDIQKGRILIDGQDIAAVSQDSVRAAIAFVPQETILFHRTLMENIRYARPQASDEEVVQAARLAHAHEFISKFPSGYETLVGERGMKLSGGERQRVAIARAILKDAPILVLDEATSSLDSESEMLIQDALKTLMRDRTTIVIAHRLSTIMQMDRIVVMDYGKVIEEGRHEELLKVQQGTYQKLWGIQAGGFTAG